MKIQLALVFSLTALAACGFDTRSDQFECSNNNDCESFQRCVDGSCVIAGTECHPDCDDCDRGICIMTCREAGTCAATVECPPSRVCRVDCRGNESCANGVDCTDATRCIVNCIGTDSCEGPIDCGISDCEVSCSGAGSCSSAVDCSDACACETECASGGDRTCVPDCPQDNRCASGPNCTSEGSGCNTCES